MKKTIVIKLKPKTSFLTPLRADIIFGHICWNIAMNKGDGELQNFLDHFKKNPIFLLSDGFIDGYLPNPLIRVDKKEKITKQEKIKIMDSAKKIKKTRFLKMRDFINICNGIYDNFDEIAKDNYNDFLIKKEAVMRNCIDKDFERVKRGGGLFSNQEFWTEDNYSLYIKILNEELFENFSIIQALKEIFELFGYGANKSTGKGSFEIVSIDEFNKFDQLKGNCGILLSHCILKNEEKNVLKNSSYKIELKYGKLGEQKAFSDNPFKKPLMQIIPGSVLATNKEYVGEMISLTDNKNILDYNYGLLVPIKLKL